MSSSGVRQCVARSSPAARTARSSSARSVVRTRRSPARTSRMPPIVSGKVLGPTGLKPRTSLIWNPCHTISSASAMSATATSRGPARLRSPRPGRSSLMPARPPRVPRVARHRLLAEGSARQADLLEHLLDPRPLLLEEGGELVAGPVEVGPAVLLEGRLPALRVPHLGDERDDRVALPGVDV